MNVTPDEIVYTYVGPLAINATLVFTWSVMALIVVGCWLITRRLRVEGPTSRWQQFMEALVGEARRQVRDLMPRRAADALLPLIGSLFVFVGTCNFLTIIPGYQPPTGSINTTAGLALLVFVAVPVRGIRSQGLAGYLRGYLYPSPIMLPMNVFGELSRTIAHAVRLFGNVMSGGIIATVLLVIAPLIIPVVMGALSLLVAMIHAWIFAVLALVYIAAASQVTDTSPQSGEPGGELHEH
ncbi:MAG: F0F1 ATP synthase subunit A [Planctomycetota bacterium]